jgi:ABC-type multidrug transport system ATPase subunit
MELRIRNLSKRAPAGPPALHDVTLTVPPGVCGLLGPGAAGKSALLRILAALEEPDQGSAHLDEIDLLGRRDAARRAVGYLPQDLVVFPKASADDLLNHYAALKGIPGYQARRDIVEALLQQVGLLDVRREPAAQLTEGMRRRFGLAVALLGRPPLLLLDAPLAELAADERARFVALLAELGKHHVVLLATREVADVAATCTQVALLDRGALRLQAPLPPARGDAARPTMTLPTRARA